MSEFYNGNLSIKNCGVPVQYTAEQLDEYLKCKQDPIYFITTYLKTVSLDDGLVDFKLYPYQIKFIEAIHNNRRVISMQPRQSGKCISGNTKYKVRNKKTGEILYVSAEEFHTMQKMSK